MKQPQEGCHDPRLAFARRDRKEDTMLLLFQEDTDGSSELEIVGKQLGLFKRGCDLVQAALIALFLVQGNRHAHPFDLFAPGLIVDQALPRSLHTCHCCRQLLGQLPNSSILIRQELQLLGRKSSFLAEMGGLLLN